MSNTAELQELKSRQQKTWASGDYSKIAWLTVPMADVLCDAADLRAGSAVLDVATGTGHVALAAARRFCTVTGVDYVPALLDRAARRAEAEDLPVDFREADAENLPFADASFDYVLSSIGVMFTADHQRAANELIRVCRPGGRVGVASWTPAGFIGELLRTVSNHAPPPPAALPPTRWGEEGTIRELFGDGVSALTFITAAVTQRFSSPEHFADFFLTHYGPTLKAAERLDDAGRRAFRDDLVAIAAKSNRVTDGTLVSDWEYRIAVATRV
ncbi:hypothetical protein GCM10010156_59380 [Planobispora rosea]|uniref:Methyltransferase type 11 domain-containing protein n=1 Tax=Planobispora rosea TaxID=35762 RepID=A0A8J3S5Q4_PLARO|nr:class I SAM-dependent methyltransferase [Planobispora rosea]GGS93261.1 hypothetical protein GCM10010156_59380 [Planobispora rosea]GIH87240.1 hypothetical protein Pro02_56480 [Planobispora rosea]